LTDVQLLDGQMRLGRKGIQHPESEASIDSVPRAVESD
jgi:hypothetical protein